MQIGIDRFVSQVTDPATGNVVSPVDRIAHLLEEIQRADEDGLDSFARAGLHGIELLGTDVAPAVRHATMVE